MRECVTAVLVDAWIHLSNSSEVLDQYMAISPTFYNKFLKAF